MLAIKFNMKKSLYNLLIVSVLLLGISACATTEKINQTENQKTYFIDSTLDVYSKVDTSFMNLIVSYKSQLDEEMNMVISIADEEMVTAKPESQLSNFIADGMLQIGKTFCKDNGLLHSVDLAIMNLGGIRTGMPKGEIRTGRMFEMLPFKNKLVIVGMKGGDLKILLDQLAEFGGEGSSGFKMGIKDRKAIDVLVDGKIIDKEKIYYVISVDYLVNGGGNITAFKNRETFRHMHQMLRSEMIKYILENYKNGKHISAKLDGRIYHVE